MNERRKLVSDDKPTPRRKSKTPGSWERRKHKIGTGFGRSARRGLVAQAAGSRCLRSVYQRSATHPTNVPLERFQLRCSGACGNEPNNLLETPR